jgi:TolB-like protein/DNA-binding winged helix-turn-helix (wHTH) protein/Flp pilus assembly protein TadD
VFDAVEIDCAGRRLFVGGNEVPLEPKAFAVLVLLASRPGNAFDRDAILDAVWGHRHVTPGVLNRVVTLIRQALGESADEHRYLHTLHGVGYRFDAATRQVATRGDLSSGGWKQGGIAPDSTNANTAGESRAPPAPVAEQTADARAGAQRAVVEGTAAPAERRMAAPVRPSRKPGFAWLALGVCALIGAGYLFTRRAVEVPASAVPTLVVLPLHPVGAAADESVFAEGLSEELITRLARIDGLHLISQTSAALAQTDKLNLNQLAERLHVTHALEGSLRQSGQQLRIDLRLVDVPGGRTLWAQDYDRSLADVFALQSEIAHSVADTLTLKLGLPGAAEDRDPQLFRDYLELRSRMIDTDVAGFAETTMRLRALVARAPDYARAHGLLAKALVQELRPSLATPADSAEAAREAARALELDPNQLEAQSVLGTLACRAMDWAQCMSRLRHALTLAPTDTIARTTYGRWLAATGYLDEALRQTGIAVASDPLNYVAIFFHARVLDTTGQHDAAKQNLDAAEAVAKVRALLLPYPRWYNAIWRHDFDAARKFALDMPEEQHFREAYIAATEALVDPSRWPQVEPLIAESERATGRYNFIRLLQPHPDMARNIAALEQVMLTGSSSYNLLLWNPESTALRRDPSFQDFLRRTHMIDYWRSNGWPAQCHAEGERAICE